VEYGEEYLVGILVGIILMFGARFADNCIVSERIAIELKNKIPPL